jgi:hypothetical protein
MVLTSEDLYFAKPDSDLVVDRLPLRCVSVISKVDRAQDALGEQAGQGRIGFSPSDRDFKRASRRKSSVKFSTTMKMDSMVDLQDGTRETFAFEIRASPEGAAHDANVRSYFSRVDTAELCDEWINDIKSAMKKVKHLRAEGSSSTTRMQDRAKSVVESTAWRCAVALAIFVNFVCSVLEAEYLPASDSPMGVLIDRVDYLLDVLFGIELLVIAFAYWRSRWGSPFIDSAWNWCRPAHIEHTPRACMHT